MKTKMNNKELLEKYINIFGWDNLIGTLMDICFEKNLSELYRELDNIIVNYIPEVRENNDKIQIKNKK